MYWRFKFLAEEKIRLNIGDKESSSDLETGAEPHRLELEEEFGKNLVSKKEICEAKRFFSLSPVKSWERNEMEREPARRYRADRRRSFFFC
ncbi:MAG: hypothetical protein PVJ67_07060 [Candidatus Pacearchaeota archaeon]|jgi:hypothetical protein